MTKKKSNGEGSISYEKEKKRWRGSITIGRDASGKPKRKQFYGKTKSEVATRMNEYKYQHANDLLPTDTNTTLEQYLLYWLYDVKKITVKPATISRYDGILRKYITGTTIGKKKLKDLRTAHLQTYYNELSKSHSASVIKNLNKVIGTALSHALNENYITKNYASYVTLPKLPPKQEVEYLSEEDQNKFLTACKGHRLECIFYMAIATGLRMGELLALKWEDIDFDNKTVSVTKSLRKEYIPDKDGKKDLQILFQTPKTDSSIRTVPIPNSILLKLNSHRKLQIEEKLKAGSAYANNNLVFATPIGTPIDQSNLRKIYKKILNSAGVPYVKFHSLRHSYATLLFTKDASPKTVQALMGHSNIGTTMNIYTHAVESKKIEAVQKLDDVFNI